MCIHKEVRVVAVFGPSCVGKSAAVKELGRLLQVEVRHCGELLKARAHELGQNPWDLSDRVHRELDDGTVAAAIGATGLTLIEGTFLDAVLAGVGSVTFVMLTATQEERIRRFASRHVVSVTVAREQLVERDRADQELRQRLYGQAVALTSGTVRVIDCSELSIQLTAVSIARTIGLGYLDETLTSAPLPGDDRR